MKPNTRLLYFVCGNLIYVTLIVLAAYYTWIAKISICFGIPLLFILLLNWKNLSGVYHKASTGNGTDAIDLCIKPLTAERTTPDLIMEILEHKNVINVIKNDLRKTSQIGYQEVWQLGLITPDQDKFDPRPDSASFMERTKKYSQDINYRYRQMEQIPLKRTAVLHSRSYFNTQLNNIMIYSGKQKYLGYPGWSYRLRTKLNRGEFINIRDIRIASDALHAQDRTLTLPEFLREDGFPLKERYVDSDPLTTERGGMIVIDRDKVLVIYPEYFLQRRLIDDEGNLIEMGLEEEFVLGAVRGVKMRPSVSKLLFENVTSHGYAPVLRYRSFPYASDYMFPILDTPMSASGWADLFIDPQGKGKLFISKDKTLAEWYEMLEKLRQLLYSELAKKDYHLLGLTKDKVHLCDYLSKKMDILKDYFLIRDWQLP